MENQKNKVFLKSYDKLMEYLTTQHHIQCQENNLIDLRNIGYYHGYKGYRYVLKKYSAENYLINFSNFSQLKSIYDFDSRLKEILYPRIMFIEMALKNRILETICSVSESPNIEDVCNALFFQAKSGKNISNKDKQKDQAKKQIDAVRSIYNKIYNNINSEEVISHYYSENNPLPIWAVFELLSLGEISKIVNFANDSFKGDVDKNMGFFNESEYPRQDNCLTNQVINIIKPLRDALSHNRVVFDLRFRQGHNNKDSDSIVDKVLVSIKCERNAKNQYNIVDYILFISYIRYVLDKNKVESKQLIADFEKVTRSFVTGPLKNEITVMNLIFGEDYVQRVKQAKFFYK